MRGIVDRHFHDNWVIPFHMGILVDLTEWWEPYKAAKHALKNTMNKTNIEKEIKNYSDAVSILYLVKL